MRTRSSVTRRGIHARAVPVSLLWTGLLLLCAPVPAQSAAPQPQLRRRAPAGAEASGPPPVLEMRVHVSRFQACSTAKLTPGALRIEVAGVPHAATLTATQDSRTAPQSHLLVVLPPNEISVHAMAVTDLIKTFADPRHASGWRIGIVDADGMEYAATDDRAVLLQELDAIRRKREPLSNQAAAWFQSTNLALRDMKRLWGPKRMLFVNAPADIDAVQVYEYQLLRVGPATLSYAAQAAQVQMFIADQAGPGLAMPFGDASSEPPLGGAAPITPEVFRAGDERHAVQLATYQSAALLAASETGGEVATSARDAVGRMERDQACEYELQVPLMPGDLGDRRLVLSVKPVDRQQKVVLLGARVMRATVVQRPPEKEPANPAHPIR